MNQPSAKDQIRLLGFAIVADLVDASDLPALQHEADRLIGNSQSRAGARNVLRKSPALLQLGATGSPAQLASALLGAPVSVTKLTVFDKSADANWKVPFHQDLTISVSHKIEAEGFGPWTIKDGIDHVQPPTGVLQRIVAVRVHLDDTPAENGALRVLPGSHRFGRIADDQIGDLRGQIPEVVCPVSAGGAMAMSPLLLHASSASTIVSRRRVLHFEYTDVQLPQNLAWA